MSEVKVNKISPRTNCGTTTLGDSGDSFVIPSGVTITNNGTQTGFGRTGTVNWDTTKKTSGFTAVSGNGYFCDTAASGAFTATLPSSPSAGDIVGLKDYNGNFANANLTIGRGGSPINGGDGADVVISTAGASILLVYVDATQGWVATQDDESVFTGATYMTATGGTITTCGNDKIHTFTGPGTFTVCSVSSTAANNLVSYVVVAGGGGTTCGGCGGSGGGGAGGYREVKSPATPYTASPLDGYGTPTNRVTVSATGYPITVGGGGTAGNPAPNVTKGNNSIFSTITSAGGGASHTTPTAPAAVNGGSGGGGASLPYPGPLNAGGAGNTPPISPPQGQNGGTGLSSPPGGPTASYRGGGGGGAGGVGSNGAFPGTGGNGGNGVTSSINGTPTARAGGGGGGAGYEPSGTQAGTKAPGGTGGGGEGSKGSGSNGTAGTVNTGGGGGGGGYPTNACTGRAGGSGVVIIRYKYQ